ncbi:hypothetical protein B0T26DRAFT_728887 [Lasiosphaeria miniovina]|uniref:Uncharacterized protein n=1 Tax=Lasiosphaeria miniovina TaxID=1954250 RepID=A0AA40DKY4_9PEZI|nr:uncharacterized protein B0T26DRAFT_728887 [Lasiosphaeria miniovina]KAK0707030.1 hypothetical protein B0T26DRAFT_728887 [Lasiosphaeria miniovina]
MPCLPIMQLLGYSFMTILSVGTHVLADLASTSFLPMSTGSTSMCTCNCPSAPHFVDKEMICQSWYERCIIDCNDKEKLNLGFCDKWATESSGNGCHHMCRLE